MSELFPVVTPLTPSLGNRQTRTPVLLTGASGYIGGRLLRRFEEEGRAVRCMSRRPEVLAGTACPSTTIVAGDVLAPASLARQALWPVRDASLGRRYFASLHIGGSPPSHAPVVQASGAC